jgi:outer membrane protein OmpA-like peptidoglycan-associated protein
MSGARDWMRLLPIAVLVTAVLAGLVTWLGAPGIEQDLTAKTQEALTAAGVPGGTVHFTGRDATLSGFPPDKALRALEVVQSVNGVRTAEISGDVAPVTGVPAPAQQPPSTSPPPSTSVPSSAPPTDQAGLQAELDRMLAENPITFQPDSARLTAEGERAAEDVAKAIARAPEGLRFLVKGYVGQGPGGERAALRLSRDRARAVANVLVTHGVRAGRIVAEGRGDAQPATADRRIEITVEQG